MVVLVDFVGGKVAHVDVGGEPGLEGCTDVTELFENNALEKGVGSDLGATRSAVGGAEALGRVAKEAARELLDESVWERDGKGVKTKVERLRVGID